MINSRVRGAFVTGFLLVLISVEGSAGSHELSKAETLLWMTDQLNAVDNPVEIRYEFNRTGTFDSGFTDTVRFIVHAVKANGMKSARLEFFTGERSVEVAPVDDTTINPVLKIYLQGDVYEMNRLTDPEGKSRERWRYFQRRIKLALAEIATVEDVVVTFDDVNYSAKKIEFSPYLNDPKRRLFEQFSSKTYTIIISKDLPGYIYSIESVVPGPRSNALPLIKDQLKLIEINSL
ncbi:MAG TPA: hypothetical protein DGR97_11145 [Gammaproteobacteria bacterium]|nr:hypothetical protein [Gammaproteobacteria bacterium]